MARAIAAISGAASKSPMPAAVILTARRSSSEGCAAAVAAERLSGALILIVVTTGALALGCESLVQTPCLPNDVGKADQIIGYEWRRRRCQHGATVVAVGSGVGAGFHVVPLFSVSLAAGIAVMYWGFLEASGPSEPAPK